VASTTEIPSGGYHHDLDHRVVITSVHTRQERELPPSGCRQVGNHSDFVMVGTGAHHTYITLSKLTSDTYQMRIDVFFDKPNYKGQHNMYFTEIF